MQSLLILSRRIFSLVNAVFEKVRFRRRVDRIVGADAEVNEKTYQKWSKICVVRLSLILFDVVSRAVLTDAA
jgi:hypothetical protein